MKPMMQENCGQVGVAGIHESHVSFNLALYGNDTAFSAH
jgi:hypothetical protein